MRDGISAFYRAAVFLLFRLARQLLRRRRIAAASKVLDALVRLAPEAMVLRVWAARTHLAQRNETAARQLLAQADLERIPDAYRHYCRVAAIYIALEDYEAADSYLGLLAARRAFSVSLWKTRGEAYALMGMPEKAVECYAQRQRLAPTERQVVEALRATANVLVDCGNPAAEGVFAELLAIRPQDAHAWYGTIDARPDIELDDPAITRIKQLIEDASIGSGGKSHLHYALGVAYDRNRNTGAAMAHFSIANRLRSSARPPVLRAARRAAVAARREVFSAALISKLMQFGSLSDELICIVGMPRSGTTLTEQLLGSHVGVYAAGERKDFVRLRTVLPAALRVRAAYPYCCRHLTASDVADLSENVLHRLRRRSCGRGRIVTKLPEDYLELGLIKILFPRAKIVHMTRNPLDVGLSCYQQNFKHLSYACDLDSIAETYRDYKDIMQHWRDVLPMASIHDMSYEELVARPDRTMRDLCEFVGIQYDASCLEFYRASRAVRTVSRWQVRRPIYQGSVNRAEAYREFLGPLLQLCPQACASR